VTDILLAANYKLEGHDSLIFLLLNLPLYCFEKFLFFLALNLGFSKVSNIFLFNLLLEHLPINSLTSSLSP